MKNLIPLITLLLITSFSFAQVPEHLTGKWKLIRWVHNGQEMDVKATYKTDQVYEVLREGNVFVSIIGDQVMEGEWRYTPADSMLYLNTGIVKAEYKLESADATTRVVSSPMIGRLEYVRQEE